MTGFRSVWKKYNPRKDLAMAFLPFGAMLAVIIILLAIDLSSTEKIEYRPKEHNPTWTQNGKKNASKNYKG